MFGIIMSMVIILIQLQMNCTMLWVSRISTPTVHKIGFSAALMPPAAMPSIFCGVTAAMMCL